jgi:hypothetical protein
MAKAFDSVSHHSIRRAMVSKGVPEVLIGVILSEYEGATTVLQRGLGKAGLTPITRGVKQGDPLSPILFNLVLDEIVAYANGATEGVRIAGHKVSILDFADNLVLAAQTGPRLQRLTERVITGLSENGLEPNPGKCRTVAVRVDKHANKWFLDSTDYLSIGNAIVPALQPEDSYKYLSILVSSTGLGQSYGRILEDGLNQLTRAPC